MFRLALQFRRNHVADNSAEDALGLLLNDFLGDVWIGTATELLGELKSLDIRFDLNPATLTKRLKGAALIYKAEYNIGIDFERNRSSRRIIIKNLCSVMRTANVSSDFFAG